MGKELSEMSLEELWALFPIALVPHRERWAADYAEIERFLRAVLSGCPVRRISHIGSTAISEIRAKDIVDVLVEVSGDPDLERPARLLEQNGFTRMSTAPDRISLNRGYTKTGFAGRVSHVHLRFAGDHDELYFRDYLNAHPQTAGEYEALKLRLWKRFPRDRDGYTGAKAAFVRTWTWEARRVYAGRYE